MAEDADIDRLPVDVISHCFIFIHSFKDLALVSKVCRKWREGVKRSLARKERLSFAGWKIDDEATSRMVHEAVNLRELDISRSCWGCRMTDDGLHKVSFAKCCGRLTSISLWGMNAITDRGIVQLVLRAFSLRHLNIGGTFITDESLFAIANNCPHLEVIILWGCRNVTGNGLIALVSKCHELHSVNIWGVSVPEDCYVSLLSIKPSLQIKTGRLRLSTVPPLIAAS